MPRRPSVLVLVLALAGSLLVPGGAGAADPAYIIGPDDVIEVQVWDNKDLNAVVFVRPDGKTSLPLVGEIQAAGRTVAQLQAELTETYAKTVKQPVVTVMVKEIKSRPVFFIGGFGRPGPMQLTQDLSLIQAVSLVGGIQPGADAENGYLLRGEKRMPIDFTRLLQKGDLSQNIRLEPGDSIVVPVADLVFIQGEVRAPGSVKYTSDLTIVRAVTQAGGPTQLAATGRVELLRGDGEKRVRIRIDLDKIMRAPEDNPDVKLRPNDIIFVPQRL
ncbi:MAG: polysaccharide export protein, partial [Candidatus Rokubacteria bacterium]|nr:polysaccharide export protein [Candidatus Rokubacteria bacterium]